jgi:hypothetical protein
MASRATYDEDFYNWTQEQAALLRDLPRAVTLPNAIDLAHIAEELEDMGKSELNSVKSFIALILEHLIKITAKGWDAPPTRHWAAEIITFHRNALRHFTPGMRQLIDLEEIWQETKADTAQKLEYADELMPALPGECPFEIEELLGKSIDVQRLLAVLALPDQN